MQQHQARPDLSLLGCRARHQSSTISPSSGDELLPQRDIIILGPPLHLWKRAKPRFCLQVSKEGFDPEKKRGCCAHGLPQMTGCLPVTWCQLEGNGHPEAQQCNSSSLPRVTSPGQEEGIPCLGPAWDVRMGWGLGTGLGGTW